MKVKKTKKVISKIAKRKGIGENEVREEMQKAIFMGYMNPETRQRWEALFGKGRVPSPEEFITKIAGLVAK